MKKIRYCIVERESTRVTEENCDTVKRVNISSMEAFCQSFRRQDIQVFLRIEDLWEEVDDELLPTVKDMDPCICKIVAGQPGPDWRDYMQELMKKVDSMETAVVDSVVELRSWQCLLKVAFLSHLKPLSSSSSNEERGYMQRAIEYYGLRGKDNLVRCMVTQEECTLDDIVAGHIYRQEWPRQLLVSTGTSVKTASAVMLGSVRGKLG